MSDEDVTRAGWSNPSGSQQPYAGHPPQQPAYGAPPQQQQQPYGYPQQPAYGPGPQDPDRRPTTVTVAAWLGIVFSALWALFCVVVVSAALSGLEEFSADMGDDAPAGAVIALFVVLVLIGGVGVLASVLSLRRSNVGRILLTVMASLSALVWLVSVLAVFPIIPLVASIATVVLLYTGGANDWFARRGPAQGGYGPPPGSPYGGAPYGGAPKGW